MYILGVLDFLKNLQEILEFSGVFRNRSIKNISGVLKLISPYKFQKFQRIKIKRRIFGLFRVEISEVLGISAIFRSF
jgi:hypothetical protein